MPGIILRTEIINDSPIPGLGRGFNAVKKQALRETAEQWHAEHLKPHFGPQNRTRYKHEPRTQFYTQIIKKRRGKGQGKYVDQVLSGRSMRFMLAFATVTGTASQATVTLRPPGYFTRPFIGSFRDRVTGAMKRITRQPDKPREVTTVDARDVAALTQFHAKRLSELAQASSKRTKKTL